MQFFFVGGGAIWKNCLSKSLHFKQLSSGVDGMCFDYLGHFAVEYSLLQNSVFSDQYRLSSDLPVLCHMPSAESPPDERINLLISARAGASGALAYTPRTDMAQVHMRKRKPSVRNAINKNDATSL